MPAGRPRLYDLLLAHNQRPRHDIRTYFNLESNPIHKFMVQRDIHNDNGHVILT